VKQLYINLIPRSRTSPEKAGEIVAQLVIKCQNFMDPEGLFPSSQDHNTGPILKKMNRVNTLLSYFLKIDLNIASPSTIGLYSGLFPAVFPTITT
jgi:hypothetical protein